HQDHVSVTDRARIQLDDACVRSHDLGPVWPRDVDAGVDLVWVWTVGVIDLEIESRATESLADAREPAVGLRPFEHSRSTACLGGRGIVFARLRCDSIFDSCTLSMVGRVLCLQ